MLRPWPYLSGDTCIHGWLCYQTSSNTAMDVLALCDKPAAVRAILCFGWALMRHCSAVLRVCGKPGSAQSWHDRTHACTETIITSCFHHFHTRCSGHVRCLHFSYSYAALMINQFSDDRNICFIEVETVLTHFGLAGESAWVNLGILYAFIAAFTCVTGCSAECMHQCTSGAFLHAVHNCRQMW